MWDTEIGSTWGKLHITAERLILAFGAGKQYQAFYLQHLAILNSVKYRRYNLFIINTL